MPKILIIDDHEETRKMLKLLLTVERGMPDAWHCSESMPMLPTSGQVGMMRKQVYMSLTCQIRGTLSRFALTLRREAYLALQ